MRKFASASLKLIAMTAIAEAGRQATTRAVGRPREILEAKRASAFREQVRCVTAALRTYVKLCDTIFLAVLITCTMLGRHLELRRLMQRDGGPHCRKLPSVDHQPKRVQAPDH